MTRPIYSELKGEHTKKKDDQFTEDRYFTIDVVTDDLEEKPCINPDGSKICIMVEEKITVAELRVEE